MSASAGWVKRDAPLVLVSCAALAFSICFYFPGYLSYDSAHQFWQVRTNQFSNQTPVVMSALWRAVHAVWPSPAAMLTLHFVAFWTGLTLLALQFWPRSLPRIGFVLVVGFLPPAFVVMGHLWSDASLIAAMTLAFGLTVTGVVQRRRYWFVLALPVILYAGSVRHNSLLAVIPLAVLWARGWLAMLTRRPTAAADPPGAFATLGLVVLLVAGSFGFGSALDRALTRERVSAWTLTALWDLAGISVRADTMTIPAFARTPGLTLEDLRQQYTPLVNVPVFVPKEHVRHGLHEERYSEEELKALRNAWLAAVASHPLSYAEHRWGVVYNLFGRRDNGMDALFFVPTVVPFRDNPPPEAAMWNLRDPFAAQVRAIRGWPIFMPAIYLAIAVVVAAWTWPRRKLLNGSFGLAFATSGLLLALPLAIVAPSAGFRYCGWLFVSSVISVAACRARISAMDSSRAT